MSKDYASSGIDFTYHQADLEEVRSDTHEDVNLPEEVEVEGRHSIVVRDPGEEVHEDELGVALSSVAWLLVRRGLPLRSAFDDDDGWCTPARDS